MYPWIVVEKRDWTTLVNMLKYYKSRLYYHSVTWRLPDKGKLKCNTDGAYRGNLGRGVIAFCIKNENGDLVFAKARGLDETTNVEVETLAIMESLTYCQAHNITGIIIETDFLILKKMLESQRKVPCELVEYVENIQVKL